MPEREPPAEPSCLETLPTDLVDRLRAQLDSWREELIDLSKRNRLLWYSTTRGSLELTRPSPSEIYGQIMLGGSWRFYVPPPPVDRQESPSASRPPRADELVTDKTEPYVLQRTLRGLERRSSQALT